MKKWDLLRDNILSARSIWALVLLCICLYLTGCASGGGKLSLSTAIYSDDIAQVKIFLDKGADVNRGQTPPLVIAARNGNPDIIKMLLEKGAKVDGADNYPFTPLEYAALNNKTEAVQLLLKAGAHVRRNCSLLSASATNGNTDIIKMALEKGAEVDCEDTYGFTPLESAAISDKTDAVRLLLKAGAHVRRNCSLLSASATNGNTDIIKMALEKGAEVDCEDKDGQTPLMRAANNGRIEAVRLLLQAGADVKRNCLPLNASAASGNTDITKMLLEKGAEVDCEDKDGVTPLESAAFNDKTEAVRFLLQAGAHVKRNCSLLTTPAANGNTDIIKMALEKGAEVDCEDKDGVTPLESAARNDKREAMRLLLQARADANHGTKEGSTLLIMAVAGRNLEVVEMLIAAGARVNHVAGGQAETALISAASADGAEFEIVRLLVEKGADVNYRTQDGTTAFSAACLKGNWDVVTYLYEKGADPKVPESPDVWLDANGMIHHVLGDYFLSIDDVGKAGDSYNKALDCYKRRATYYSSQATKLAWKQFGALMLDAMVSGVADGGAARGYSQPGRSTYQPRQSGYQSRPKTYRPAVRYVSPPRTGLGSPITRTAGYKQSYMSTFGAMSVSLFSPPSQGAGTDEQKYYMKAQAKQFEELSALMGKMLPCFEKNPGVEECRACVQKAAGVTAEPEPTTDGSQPTAGGATAGATTDR